MLTPALALSAIKSLMRFRERLDTILSLREATADLPFSLPPAPMDTQPHLPQMFEFFDSDEGQLILELNELDELYQRVKAAPGNPALQDARRRVFQLFYEASDVVPFRLAPDKPPQIRADPELRLAYYTVSSARLSKNPATARILLAAADTLLEFGGENATVLISNPKTAAIISTILNEFAIKRDFDDADAEEIFKTLLGAALVAVTEHGSELSDEPLVNALVGALADVRENLGDDFVAGIVSKDGFERLLASLATHVADDPDLMPDDPRLRAILVATLNDIADKVPALLEDPTALLGVLEVTATAAAGQVESLLEGKLGNRPLIPQVLIAVSKQIEELGQNDDLFRTVASGEILNGVLRTALTTIAQNPDNLATTANVSSLVATLTTNVADLLAHEDLGSVFTVESLREITGRALTVLAENPDALGIDHEFASKVVVSVMKAASRAVEDGLTIDDLADLAAAALDTSIQNLRLLELDDRLIAVLTAAGESLGEDSVRQLLTADGRKTALLQTLSTVAANPVMWRGFAEADLVQPLVQAVISGLANDPSKLLSGPILVESIRRVLTAVALRGRQLIDGNVDSEQLSKLLSLALKSAEKQIGIAIDGENLPVYLERVVRGFLKSPFDLTNLSAPEFANLIAPVLDQIDTLIVERLQP